MDPRSIVTLLASSTMTPRNSSKAFAADRNRSEQSYLQYSAVRVKHLPLTDDHWRCLRYFPDLLILLHNPLYACLRTQRARTARVRTSGFGKVQIRTTGNFVCLFLFFIAGILTSWGAGKKREVRSRSESKLIEATARVAD